MYQPKSYFTVCSMYFVLATLLLVCGTKPAVSMEDAPVKDCIPQKSMAIENNYLHLMGNLAKAYEAGESTRLVASLQAKNRPLTVFAPTDAALASPSALKLLQKHTNFTDALFAMTFEGSIPIESLLTGQELVSVGGDTRVTVTVNADSGVVTLLGPGSVTSTVITANLNGTCNTSPATYTHTVDTMIVPQSWVEVDATRSEL